MLHADGPVVQYGPNNYFLTWTTSLCEVEDDQ